MKNIYNIKQKNLFTIFINCKILRNFSQRSSNFKKLNDHDIDYFRTFLPFEDVLTNDLDDFNTDWLKKYKGNSSLVLRPKTTSEVSKILKYCNKNKLAIVPQGGNTGLVGGSVPVNDEIIIKLSKMNKIISFDEISSTLHCEAGCILENLNDYLGNKGYTMPIDLGSRGSCFIGGNLATNAGGINFVKYGSLRSNCKGIKAVIADGSIINSLNPLPKNNTGYDLKQLFIGSEGTLGIITECLINTPLNPVYKDLALIACNNFNEILEIYQEVKLKIGNNLYAIEFFDNDSLLIQEKHGRKCPFDKKYSFYLILEIASNGSDNFKNLEEFLIFMKPIDALIPQSEFQKKKIWELRETIQEGASREGIVLSYDISLPLKHFYEIVEISRKKIGNLGKVIGYGHIGDYNLHLNVCYDKFIKDDNFIKLKNLMEPFVFDFVANYNGSISAEHGIGIQKTQYLNRSQTEENINLMRLIKTTLDSENIMNPYKLINI